MLKTIPNFILLTGIKEHHTAQEKKMIRLINLPILISYVSFSFFFLLTAFHGRPITQNLNVIGLILNSLALFAVYKNNFSLAKLLILFNMQTSLFLISNFTDTGVMLENFYMIIPILSLHFFDNKWINYGTLIVCILTFHIPNFYFHHYGSWYNSVHHSVLFIIMFSGVNYFKTQNLQNERLLNKGKLEAEKMNVIIDQQAKASKLTALKAQMNPHFIFNALNSVQDLIMQNDIRLTNLYLGQFAELMRKTLDVSSKDYIQVNEEIELLELYLSLEKLRFGKEFNCQITSNSSAEIQTLLIPAMLIQPYVENAVKHGLLHKKGIKQLNITFFIKDNALFCEIEDNGVGRQKSEEINSRRAKYHKSFATKANKNRIELINERAKEQTTLKTIDLFENGIASGTKVVFQFPIKQQSI